MRVQTGRAGRTVREPWWHLVLLDPAARWLLAVPTARRQSALDATECDGAARGICSVHSPSRALFATSFVAAISQRSASKATRSWPCCRPIFAGQPLYPAFASTVTSPCANRREQWGSLTSSWLGSRNLSEPFAVLCKQGYNVPASIW